jgi:hypothetical protein
MAKALEKVGKSCSISCLGREKMMTQGVSELPSPQGFAQSMQDGAVEVNRTRTAGDPANAMGSVHSALTPAK